MVGVGQRLQIFIFFNVSMVVTLMDAPKSIKVFGTKILLIKMETIGTLGSTYFFILIFVHIRLAIFATTFTIDGYFFFLPYFLRHNSLIVLVYIGMLFIASDKGILTHLFFNSFKKSRSKGVIYFSNNNLFGKRGDLVNCDCSF